MLYRRMVTAIRYPWNGFCCLFSRRGVPFLAILLAIVLPAVLLSASAATAAPSMAPPLTLVNIGVATAGSAVPVPAPVSVDPGGQFNGLFYIDNVATTEVRVTLGLALFLVGGPDVTDGATHTCQVPAGARNFICTRPFQVASNTAAGTYQVRFTISANVSDYGPVNAAMEMSSGVKVPLVARLCASPATLDLGNTAPSANLTIQNCGNAPLTWTAACAATYFGLSPTAGTNDATIAVTANRAVVVAPGRYSAEIRITSNGGNQTVVAYITVDPLTPTPTPTATGAPTGTATATPTATATAAATPTTPPSGPGQFYPQTNFWVRDGVPLPDGSGRAANFLAEFSRFGGVATLGYPASRPYWRDGFFYQVFQRGILQWRPDYAPPQAVFANTMDWLHSAGRDAALAVRGIPPHFAGDDGAGGDFSRAREIRFGWMTEQAIRDAYFANPSPGQIPDSIWDPVTFYGLPTSQPQRSGPFTVQRFQRYVFQKWEQAVMGMPPPGSVVGVLAGDLAKEAGLVPTEAMQTETP